MTESEGRVFVRVTHHFHASAERVYDAFLDPAKLGRFMFATATGHIVRCEVDARIGGTFVIVDRRAGEDVAHTGTYLELDRPRRIVFTLSVEKYSSETDKVTIDIAALSQGCELTLTHESKATSAEMRRRTEAGWASILDLAGEILGPETASCGIGLAIHGTIPAKMAVMFEALAETLELHRAMLVTSDPASRAEDTVYSELAASWHEIAKLVGATAARMQAQTQLAMGAHDQTAWGEAHVRAFEKFTRAQSQVAALMRVASERDQEMFASITKATQS